MSVHFLWPMEAVKDDTDRGATTVPRRSTTSSNLVVFMVALLLFLLALSVVRLKVVFLLVFFCGRDESQKTF